MKDKVIDNPPPTFFREMHSEEIREIINRPPNWLLRWGIGICFSVVILFLMATWWVKYPDIVTVSLTLTAGNAPREVIARTEGKITGLLVDDGAVVNRQQILAYLESTTSPDEALELEEKLGQLERYVSSQDWRRVIDFRMEGFRELGELQNNFQAFYLQFTQLKTYLQGGVIVKKRDLLLKDIRDLTEMLAILESQQKMQKRDYELAQEEFKVQERLYQDKAIPVLEFKKEQGKLLAREAPLKQIEVSRVQNSTSQTSKQKELLELDNMVSEQKVTFINSLLTLRSELAIWKQRYVLLAPVAGKVSYLSPWQEQQSVKAGEPIIAVEPEGESLYGIVKIPQANLGKLRDGQSALVKLDGFPYREFGLIAGSLANLSNTTGKDSTYWATIRLPNGLTTRYGHKLNYKSGMKGTADIITEDRRLLERFISALRGG